MITFVVGLCSLCCRCGFGSLGCLCTFTLMWFGFLFGPAWILLVCLLLCGLLFDLVLAVLV